MVHSKIHNHPLALRRWKEESRERVVAVEESKVGGVEPRRRGEGGRGGGGAEGEGRGKQAEGERGIDAHSAILRSLLTAFFFKGRMANAFMAFTFAFFFMAFIAFSQAFIAFIAFAIVGRRGVWDCEREMEDHPRAKKTSCIGGEDPRGVGGGKG